MSSPDVRVFDAARAHQLRLTKPAGSLGRLEDLACWYASIRGSFPAPAPEPAAMLVFAADHGVVEEGVSAYPQAVTAAMVANMVSGGAAISVLARRFAIDLLLVDVGVACDLAIADDGNSETMFRGAKIGRGTRNLRLEPAMSNAERDAAIAVGRAAADEAIQAGAQVIALGEMGIGNTTPAAALVCAMTGADPESVTGRGTGIDDSTHARKVRVVRDALALHKPSVSAPLRALAMVGGFEFAAMLGAMFAAAEKRRPIVLDGFLTNATALVAVALEPSIKPYLLASHRSTEPGASVALAALGLEPLLDLRLRLGEGSGAALAIDLLRTAHELSSAMATFDSAAVPEKSAP